MSCLHLCKQLPLFTKSDQSLPASCPMAQLSVRVAFEADIAAIFDPNRFLSVKLFLGAASFLALAAALAIGAFALFGPEGGRVEAREDCAHQEVALDEGYGVSRIETRNVCAR